MRKTTRAIFGGAMALQAAPLLKKSGRTPQALANTATGFIRIGVAGAMAETALDMVTPRKGLTKKKKKRKRR